MALIRVAHLYKTQIELLDIDTKNPTKRAQIFSKIYPISKDFIHNKDILSLINRQQFGMDYFHLLIRYHGESSGFESLTEKIEEELMITIKKRAAVFNPNISLEASKRQTIIFPRYLDRILFHEPEYKEKIDNLPIPPFVIDNSIKI